jgi:acyl-CoA oxidase
MTDSPELQKNPGLYVFLPLLYAVWSDEVLTPREHAALQELIRAQGWLTPEEKTFLEGLVAPNSPPSVADLHAWRSKLEATRPSPGSNQVTLFDLGLSLATHHGGRAVPPSLSKDFDKAEAALGLVDREVAASLLGVPSGSITSSVATKASFDPAVMSAILDGDQAATIKKVKALISDPEFDYLDSDSLAELRAKVLHWCRLLAQRGIGALAYPKEYGGQADMAAYFTAMETLSYRDLSMVVKFGVQFGLWGMSVYSLGTRKHHDKYLKDIGTLTLPGCFAMTETGHGSNVRGVETTATYNKADRTFTIHTPNEQARKEYIGNAALHGRKATVFAKLIIDGTDYGVNAFIVPLRDASGQFHPGVTITDCGRKLGLNGVDNGLISFNQVVIPKDEMLDRFASVSDEGKFESPITSDSRRFFTMLGTLVGGRIGIPRAGLSASKSALTIAIRYGDGRTQFGPENAPEVPVLNYRTHQRRLIPYLANAYALNFALRYLTSRYLSRREDEMQEIEALAAGLKSWATWNTTATIQECREACGGKGYLAENRFAALKADTDIFTTFEGDNTVLMQLVAKSRLTEFKKEFSNINFFGILNYLGDQARTSIAEKNPIIVRNTDEEHLMDPGFHRNAFEYRDREILSSSARRLKRHIDEGMNSFDAFNVSQHQLIAVGNAYVERVILEQFQEAVAQTKDPKCKAALEKLCALFALFQIEKHAAWYLETGYMEGVKTKAVRKQVSQLCWEIRQDAVPLVDAFGIPDRCLSAPIATRGQLTA